MYVHVDAGIEKPGDLRGKRVGRRATGVAPTHGSAGSCATSTESSPTRYSGSRRRSRLIEALSLAAADSARSRAMVPLLPAG